MTAKKAAEAVTEAPEPVQPVLGYKVVGQKAIYGVEPGEFIESLTPDEVRLHTGAGSIALTEKEA